MSSRPSASRVEVFFTAALLCTRQSINTIEHNTSQPTSEPCSSQSNKEHHGKCSVTEHEGMGSAPDQFANEASVYANPHIPGRRASTPHQLAGLHDPRDLLRRRAGHRLRRPPLG